jgi:hypothetical protein
VTALVGGVDPLGGALWATGRPRPAARTKDISLLQNASWSTRESTADQGVRPTFVLTVCSQQNKWHGAILPAQKHWGQQSLQCGSTYGRNA